MIVMKFGGSSLANAERLRHVAEIVQMHLCEDPIVVLSAMGKTTDQLIEAGQRALKGNLDPSTIEMTHREVVQELHLENSGIEELLEELLNLLRGIYYLQELTPKTMDTLLSFGERLSVRIFAAYLNQQSIGSEHFDGWSLGIVTDSSFNRAEVLDQSYDNIQRVLGTQRSQVSGTRPLVPIVTGFIAKNEEGVITTLGRGGSDLTAAVIGAALGAREIQVWKDVHGILTSDPRIVANPNPVPRISFEEASELAYFGAKVLHPTSIVPAMQKGIPVRVKNSYEPAHPGTLIDATVNRENGVVTAITCKSNQVMLHICSTRMLGQYGFLARVFQIFAALKISVDVIATSEVCISLTIENSDRLQQLQQQLEEVAKVTLYEHRTIVSVIGSTKHSSEILERSLACLQRSYIRVQMISLGASNVNTNLVVDDSCATDAVNILHNEFIERRIA